MHVEWHSRRPRLLYNWGECKAAGRGDVSQSAGTEPQALIWNWDAARKPAVLFNQRAGAAKDLLFMFLNYSSEEMKSKWFEIDSFNGFMMWNERLKMETMSDVWRYDAVWLHHQPSMGRWDFIVLMIPGVHTWFWRSKTSRCPSASGKLDTFSTWSVFSDFTRWLYSMESDWDKTNRPNLIDFKF